MTAAVKRIVLLVGSAKPDGTSTSQALGQYLLGRLNDAGAAAQVFLVNHVRSGVHMSAMLAAIDEADLFVLCSPVYVDSLPSLVVAAFEQIAAHRRTHVAPGGPRFVAIVNCGFPESRHCRAALEICRIFSQSARLKWGGGLALGGGEMIHGTPLREIGGVARRVRQALDATAASLAAGGEVPDEAVKMMAKPLVPTQMYTLLGNFGWRQKARKQHARDPLNATPFTSRS